MQHIFQIELEGLIAQFAHTVSLSLIPADGVRIVDVLNDFEFTETGRYRLPNLQAGSPLDIVVQLKVGAQAAGAQLRLVDLHLGRGGHPATLPGAIRDRCCTPTYR